MIGHGTLKCRSNLLLVACLSVAATFNLTSCIQIGSENYQPMSISRSYDGLPSEAQSPRVIPNDDDKGKQPLVEPPVLQASNSKPPIQKTGPLNSTSIPNVDYKGKKPLEEPPMSKAWTTEPWSGDPEHHQECKRSFQLRIPDNVFETSAFEAGRLLPLLKNFGFAPDLTKDDLRYMLKLAGYADENGTVDFERFTVFAKDFQLSESVHFCDAAIESLDDFDRGPPGYFFACLEAAVENESFTNIDFIEAFRSFEMELTDDSVDSLVRYANLPTSVNITFDDFLKVLRREDEEHMQRTGLRSVSRKMHGLERGYRVGRLMAFVSAYSRSYHFVKGELAMTLNGQNGDLMPRTQIGSENYCSMSICRRDDGLPSESQSPRVIPNDNDKGKHPLVDPLVPQSSNSAPPIEETRPLNTTSIPHSHDRLSPESQSRLFIPNVDYKGKKPLEEPPMSEAWTSGPWIGETGHRQECKRCFQLLIGPDADYETSAFEAGELLPLLKKFRYPNN